MPTGRLRETGADRRPDAFADRVNMFAEGLLRRMGATAADHPVRAGIGCGDKPVIDGFADRLLDTARERPIGIANNKVGRFRNRTLFARTGQVPRCWNGVRLRNKPWVWCPGAIGRASNTPDLFAEGRQSSAVEVGEPQQMTALRRSGSLK